MVSCFRFTADTDLITTDEAELTQNNRQGSVGMQKKKRDSWGDKAKNVEMKTQGDSDICNK